MKNKCGLHGGGMYCKESSNPIITNVIFQGNIASGNDGYGHFTGYGGGLYCDDSDPYLKNVVFNNDSSNNAGGVYLINSNAVIINTSFIGNFSNSGGGGGISCSGGSLTLKNSLLTNNKTIFFGAGIICSNSNPIFQNVIFDNNLSIYYQGEIYFQLNSEPVFTNCIIRGDTLALTDSSSITISHCNIENGDTGIINNGTGTINWLSGNIDEDPLFLGTGDHPYQLSPGSPCIDTGTTDTTSLNLPPYDMLGNERIFDGDGIGLSIIDMGAYEFNAPPYLEASIVHIPEMKALCFPNPFSTSTTISFEIEKAVIVVISIYNQQGQLIEKITSAQKPAGKHNIKLNTENWKPGLYLCRLQVGDKFTTKKIIKITGK